MRRFQRRSFVVIVSTDVDDGDDDDDDDDDGDDTDADALSMLALSQWMSTTAAAYPELSSGDNHSVDITVKYHRPLYRFHRNINDDYDDDDDDNDNTNSNDNAIIIIIIIIVIIIIMMMIIITTMTIVLTGAIRDFYNLLTAPRTVSNTYAQVAWAQL